MKAILIFTVDRKVKIFNTEKWHQMWGSQLGHAAAEVYLSSSYTFEWVSNKTRGKYYWGKMVGQEPNNKEELEKSLIDYLSKRPWFSKIKCKKIDDCWYFMLNKESQADRDFEYIAEYAFIIDIADCASGHAEINFALETSLEWDEM